MDRKVSLRPARSRSRIARAMTALVVIALAIALAPVAYATSLVPDGGTLAKSSLDPGAGSTAVEAAQQKQLEIMYREYNWWDHWSTPSYTPVVVGEDVDDLFAHMEQYPGMYTQAGVSGNAPRFDGSNTLSDYRSPAYDGAASDDAYSTPSEGFIPGNVSNQRSAMNGDRSDVIAQLRTASAPGSAGVENDGTASSAAGSASDIQFIEENMNLGEVYSPVPGPGDGISDFRFIEENTLLPGSNEASGDVAPDYSGKDERGF